MGAFLPSEESVWSVYYDKEEMNVKFSTSSMYEAIHHTGYENRTAFTYYGRSFTYGLMYEWIDRTSKAFIYNGIGKGDVVMLMLPTLPESLYCFYALNRIGAISNLVDVRTMPQQLEDIAHKTKPRIVVLMDFHIKRMDPIKIFPEVEKIVVLRGCESIPLAVPFYKTGEFFNGMRKTVKNNERYVFWPEFIKTAASCTLSPDVTVEADDIAAIFQTSGTTGFPKSAVHTNFNLNNSSMMKYFHMNDPVPGDTVLSILPLFTLFGFVFDIHMPLRYGMKLAIVPLFRRNSMADLILSHKPNHIFSVPSQWESVARCRKMKRDLSFLKTVFVAGEVLDVTLRNSINNLLKDGGSKAEICPDYGMTETGGTISFVHPEASRDDVCGNGYSGIPMPLCRICIYDDDTGKELGYNQPGEITVQVPFMVKGYYNDPEATSHLFRKHDDGQVWLHTGDAGYLTEKGHLYVIGRKKRMIVRFDGSKLFPVELESVINKVEGVTDCSVVGAPDPEHLQGKVPFAFVVPATNRNRELIEREIIQLCKSSLPVQLQPYRIKFIDQMPRNSMGKTDYLKLTQML